MSNNWLDRQADLLLNIEQAVGASRSAETLGDIRDLMIIEAERKKSLERCPWCGGRLEGQFEKCNHCGSEIAWVSGIVCKPSEVDELRKNIADAQDIALEIHKKIFAIAGMSPPDCPSRNCPSVRPGARAEIFRKRDESRVLALSERWAESFKRSGICPVCEKRRNKTFWRLAIIGCIAMPVIAAAWVAAIVYAIR